jgi:hypothetical protein
MQKKSRYRISSLATAGILTLRLGSSTLRLIGVLDRNTHTNVVAPLGDAVLLAIVNVLTFSIWYWLIDPRGMDEAQPTAAPGSFSSRSWRIPFPVTMPEMPATPIIWPWHLLPRSDSVLRMRCRSPGMEKP